MHTLLTTILAMVGVVILIPAIIRWAGKRTLLDENDERKIHTEKVSSLGGLAIWPVVIAICLLSGNTSLYVLSGMSLLWGISLADDLSGGVAPYIRLFVQVLASILAFAGGYQFNAGLPVWLNLLLTIVFVVWMINAFNFIDGINGLAGSLGLMAALLFGEILLYTGKPEMAGFAFAVAGGLAGFLKFNFGHRARIFMGDNGSAVLGMALAVMLLAAMNQEQHFGALSLWGLALVSIPLVDLIRVVLIRLSQGRSPFSADRNHIHHLLVDNEVSAPGSSILLVGWQSLLIIVTLIYNSIFVLALGVLTGFLLVIARSIYIRKKETIILSFLQALVKQ